MCMHQQAKKGPARCTRLVCTKADKVSAHTSFVPCFICHCRSGAHLQHNCPCHPSLRLWQSFVFAENRCRYWRFQSAEGTVIIQAPDTMGARSLHPAHHAHEHKARRGGSSAHGTHSVGVLDSRQLLILPEDGQL